MHTSRQIAGAVNGYLKALRELGREETTVLDVANALGISQDDVEAVFKDWHISAAKLSKLRKKAHVAPMSPVIELGHKKSAQVRG